MTHFEYELAFRAVIGLAGCAIALVAMAFDSREPRVYTLDFGDKPIRNWTTTNETLVSLDPNKIAAAVERVLVKEPKA